MHFMDLNVLFSYLDYLSNYAKIQIKINHHENLFTYLTNKKIWEILGNVTKSDEY